MPDPQFVFTCCQLGAESALKSEIERNWNQLRFAFSRPGFVTFKNVGEKRLAESFALNSVFARTYGFSLGNVKGDDDAAMSRLFRDIVGEQTFDQLHVWPRDTAVPGEKRFLPGINDDQKETAQIIWKDAQDSGLITANTSLNRIARTGDNVLDVILIDRQQWWIGQHQASSQILRQPGGVIPVTLPAHAVSRAYLKTMEALRWSRLPIRKGDACVEIGSAPGGSCQALLEQGLHVTGIDPSAMDPVLIKHPNFTHIKKRGADLRRKEFSKFRWLTIDTNVAPKHTLDTLEAIVTHDSVRLHGMLITLKLLDWKLAEELPSYVDRIRTWGFGEVRVRQLANNRQEVCVAVTRNRTSRRISRLKRQTNA